MGKPINITSGKLNKSQRQERLTSLPLDCVIIGHNDIDFRAVEADLKKTQDFSAAYRDLKANSLNFRGERITYMNLLNQSLKMSRGRDHNLYVCELPHLGAAYLKSYLRKRDFSAEIINSFNHEQDLLKDILSDSLNVVAITTTLYVEHTPIIDIVNFIRRHNPATKIVVGGPYVFNLCSTQKMKTLEFVFREIGADIYIFDSQGEFSLSLILEEMRQSKKPDFSRIPNLIYRDDDDNFHETIRTIEDNDMDKNSVDWNYFDESYYKPSVQIRTARSCAFECAFCKYPAMAGPLNLTSLGVIENELRTLDAAGVRNVVFIDDTFNVPLPRFKEICRMIIRNKFNFDWYSFFRCSNSDDEAFDLMAASRCKGVFLGLESGDPTILVNMNKFAKADRYQYGIRKLKERDITTFASLIVGYPGETRQTFRNTLNFIEDTGPTFYRAELYYHYTNVPIHAQADKFGIRGAGYSWQHNTMDWREASDLVQVMYKTVKSSSVLPGYMFDFWSIPYLIGKGIPVDQLVKFTNIAQELLIQSFDDTIPNTEPQEKKLMALFRN